MTLKVLYDGPQLSGRRTSVSALLRGVGVELDPFVDRYSLPLDFQGTKHSLEIEILLARDNHPAGLALADDPLPDADGVVFVIDSHPLRQAATRDRWRRLSVLGDLPVVFQVNKRDLPDAVAMATIMAEYNSPCCAYVESIATADLGTTEAMKMLLQLIDAKAFQGG